MMVKSFKSSKIFRILSYLKSLKKEEKNMRRKTISICIIVLLTTLLMFPYTVKSDVYMKHKQHTDAMQMMGRSQPAEDLIVETWILSDKIIVINKKQKMIIDLKKGIQGDHPSNCGGLIAYSISKKLSCEAFIVDPVVVDELDDLARLSGMPLIKRRSIFHALNQKAIARQAAKKLGKSYQESNFIVAHLGGGITVGAHKKGRVIDVNNGLDGEGPYSPERSGGVPVGDLVTACFSGVYTFADAKKLIKGHGGVVAYLGTNDMRLVEEEIKKGNENFKLVFEGVAYQVAKEIGASAAVLNGEIDAICLTGGLAHSELIVNWIVERINWIAPVLVYAGEEEMHALAMGALRILRAEEEAKEYV